MPLFDIAVAGNFVTMTDHETKFEVKGEVRNLSLSAIGELMHAVDAVSFKKAAWTKKPVHLMTEDSALCLWYDQQRWRNNETDRNGYASGYPEMEALEEQQY